MIVVDTKGSIHPQTDRDEENKNRQTQDGDLSTPSLPLSDRELDIRVPSPNAPMDDDLRPRTQKPGDRV